MPISTKKRPESNLRLAFAIAMILIPVCGRAESELGSLVRPIRGYDDGTEIGRAMNICEKHSYAPVFVYPEGNTPRAYDQGWEDCNKIRVEWEKGETARAWRETAEKDRRDKEWIALIAKQIGKP